MSQQDTVSRLTRLGFRVVNRLSPDHDQSAGDIVMERKRGSFSDHAIVGEDGLISGQTFGEYAMSIQGSDRSASGVVSSVVAAAKGLVTASELDSEALAWANIIVDNYIHQRKDMRSMLYAAAKQMGLAWNEVELRDQRAGEGDYRRKEGVYFILTGLRFPGPRGYIWGSSKTADDSVAVYRFPASAEIRGMALAAYLRTMGMTPVIRREGSDIVLYLPEFQSYSIVDLERFYPSRFVGMREFEAAAGTNPDSEKLFDKVGIPVVDPSQRMGSMKQSVAERVARSFMGSSRFKQKDVVLWTKKNKEVAIEKIEFKDGAYWYYVEGQTDPIPEFELKHARV